MPIATTTITRNGSTHISLKTVMLSPEPAKHFSPAPSPSQSSPTASTATVRKLYHRATRAFLNRDIGLTYTLLDTAFTILQPPPTTTPDVFADDRRKWDILRITLESTVYGSPPTQAEQSTLPESLRTALSDPPHTLISKFYSRTLALFTPADSVMPGSSASHVPSQVLATLVLASLRVDCPDLGRVMIEDWLARRDTSPLQFDDVHEDGYSKILELYCLHVLPKLQQWDYASEFLEYESELPVKTRERLKSQLKTLHAESRITVGASRSSVLLDPSDPVTPRPYSPASSSSSLSTTSTHTIVPTIRANGHARPRSHSSDSSKSDATARAPRQSHNSGSKRAQNGHARRPSSGARSQSRTTLVGPSTLPVTPGAPPVAQSTAVTRLDALSLLRATVQPYLTTGRLTTLFILFVVFPVVSWLIRRRKKAIKTALPDAAGAVANAELVRRRLGGIEAGVMGRVWREVARVITDTVKMAGSGLV